MLANFDGAAETLQKTQYKDVPLADFKRLDEVLEVLHVGRVAASSTPTARRPSGCSR